jgi:CheY-like chemotaxis protein
VIAGTGIGHQQRGAARAVWQRAWRQREQRTPQLHDRRALLVEDGPEALGILRDWIRAKGWDVRTAHSGEEALNIAESHRPHLVIADYHLQELISS